jgi:hypothetical protein
MHVTDPAILQTLGLSSAAAGMIVLAQAKNMLEARASARCAACKRLLAADRRCPKCG